MAKLYFRYGAMNSGKSTLILQIAHNYEERGMEVLLMKPGIDSKGKDRIVSRLGLSRKADRIIQEDSDVRDLVSQEVEKRKEEGRPEIACILIDEAQFLSRKQVDQTFSVVMDRDIPVICYGLRTDFRGEGFEGSRRLLELAHSLEELKTICHCGKKAIMNIRKINGKPVFEGDQVFIEDTDQVEYEAVCGQDYFKARRKAGLPALDQLDE